MTRHLVDHLAEIGEQLSAHARWLLLADYDGTLVPIAPRPDLAHLPPATAALLGSLAALPGGAVGVLSGRSLADVRRQVGVESLVYAGNHGLEIEGASLTHRFPPDPHIDRLAQQLAAGLAPIAGAWVENKRLTLAVHFRQVPSGERPLVEKIVHSLADGAWRVGLGKCVFDIYPRLDWHKGRAARWIAEQMERPPEATVYLGDDRTDEDAFVDLADGITIKVGPGSPTAANYRAESPLAAVWFLHWLHTWMEQRNLIGNRQEPSQ